MVKAIFSTVIITLFVCGVSWFFIGRNDLRAIRSDFDTSYRDFKEVKRSIIELRTTSDGFATDLVTVKTGIKAVSERLESSNDRLSKSSSIVREQLDKMEQLENWHKQSLILSRDLGDVAFDLRRFSEESREEK